MQYIRVDQTASAAHSLCSVSLEKSLQLLFCIFNQKKGTMLSLL